MKFSKAEQEMIAGVPLTEPRKEPDSRHGNHGKNNAASKLDEAKVRHIRANCDTLSDEELGRIHGVHAQTIRHVRTNQTWKHVV